MSKQAEAKEAQGYTTSVRNCGNCAHMTSERGLPEWMREDNADRANRGLSPCYTVEAYGIEKNLRCGIGDFAIKKTATCSKHKAVG